MTLLEIMTRGGGLHTDRCQEHLVPTQLGYSTFSLSMEARLKAKQQFIGKLL